MFTLPSLDEARALGATLRAVDERLLRAPAPGVRTHWYRGGEPYLDATVDEDRAGVVLVEVRVRGRFARWSRERGLVTGGTDEGAIGAGVPVSRFEGHDPAPDPALLAVVCAVLEGSVEVRLQRVAVYLRGTQAR